MLPEDLARALREQFRALVAQSRDGASGSGSVQGSAADQFAHLNWGQPIHENLRWLRVACCPSSAWLNDRPPRRTRFADSPEPGHPLAVTASAAVDRRCFPQPAGQSLAHRCSNPCGFDVRSRMSFGSLISLAPERDPYLRPVTSPGISICKYPRRSVA
jgi:hypothetical protein